MSFAHTLSRLREAAADTRTGKGPGNVAVVPKKDLRDILFHFDRLDSEARIRARADEDIRRNRARFTMEPKDDSEPHVPKRPEEKRTKAEFPSVVDGVPAAIGAALDAFHGFRLPEGYRLTVTSGEHAADPEPQAPQLPYLLATIEAVEQALADYRHGDTNALSYKRLNEILNRAK